MVIIVINIPVEAHYSIILVVPYYGPLFEIDSIIIAHPLRFKSKPALQVSFKAFNDLRESYDLVLILMIFGAYLPPAIIDVP